MRMPTELKTARRIVKTALRHMTDVMVTVRNGNLIVLGPTLTRTYEAQDHINFNILHGSQLGPVNNNPSKLGESVTYWFHVLPSNGTVWAD